MKTKVLRTSILTLIFLILFVLLIPVPAHGNLSGLVVDNADLFTSAEEMELASTMTDIREKYGIKVFILTEDNYPDTFNSLTEYLEYFGETMVSSPYVALAIDPFQRDYAIDICGNDIFDTYNEKVQDKMESKTVAHLKNNEWYEASVAFLEEVERPLHTFSMPSIKSLIIIFAIACIVGFIFASSRTKANKTTHLEKQIATTATGYIAKNNINLDVKEDSFLFKQTSKTPRPQNTSSGSSSRSHSSSSRSSSPRTGSSHTGRSGKF